MQITLSGGDFGGILVDWPEGQEIMQIENCIYRLFENQGIFVGYK